MHTIAQRRPPAALRAVAVVALGLAAACAPGEKPPTDEPRAAGADRPGAEELTDLARLSREVFAEMQARGECAPDGPPNGRLDYAVEVTVEGRRIVSARLVSVSAELGGFSAPLLPDRWPASLVASVRCLEPHLRARPLGEPPPDGSYESRFSLGAGADGTAPPTTGEAVPPDLPDPAEPGLPDLQRIARHVFAQMHRVSGHCSLRNPYGERLAYAVEVEVRGGAIVRATLVDARLERPGGSLPLTRDAWPEALERFAGCFAPHLEGLVLDPAPADGVYRPDYAVRAER